MPDVRCFFEMVGRVVSYSLNYTSGIMIDYHVHTLLCQHAEGTMAAYIQRAVEIGMSEICFLDHFTIQNRETDLSMTPEEIPFYFHAVQLLKQQYEKVIQVKAGIEIDFNPEHTALFQEITGRYAFDVVAVALHFPGGLNIVSRRSPWRYGEKDTDYVYNLYFEQLENMLDYNYFDVICHFDLIKKFGRTSSRSFDKEIHQILSKIKVKNLTVEVNTSGYNHLVQEAYPSPDIIAKCCEQGINITLGSDAHHPTEVGQHYDRILPVLRSAGYRHLTTFTKRKGTLVDIE